MQDIQQHMDSLKAKIIHNGGYVSNFIALSNFNGSHRGIIAESDIELDSTLLKIPFNCCFNSYNARNHPVIGKSLEGVSEDDAIVLFLMHVKLNPKENDIFSLHSSLFPEIGKGDAGYTHLLFWEEEELNYLAGCECYERALTIEEEIRKKYISLVSNVFINYPEIYSLFEYTLREYQWAVATLLSRGMTFQINKETEIKVIVPICDMFNHDSNAKISHFIAINNKVEKEEEIFENSFIGLFNSSVVKMGDEVNISYGNHHDNGSLLELYGMALENNEADRINIWSPLDPESKDGVSKLEILTNANILCNELPFYLSKKEPLPKELYACVAVIVADTNSEDLIKIANGEDILSLQHKSLVKSTLLNVIQEKINNYPDSLIGSKQELDTEKSIGSFCFKLLGSTERYKYMMALITRINELEILHKSKETLESL